MHIHIHPHAILQCKGLLCSGWFNISLNEILTQSTLNAPAQWRWLLSLYRSFYQLQKYICKNTSHCCWFFNLSIKQIQKRKEDIWLFTVMFTMVKARCSYSKRWQASLGPPFIKHSVNNHINTCLIVFKFLSISIFSSKILLEYLLRLWRNESQIWKQYLLHTEFKCIQSAIF